VPVVSVLAHDAEVTRLRPSYVVIKTGESEHLARQFATRTRQGAKRRHVEVMVSRWVTTGGKFTSARWIDVARVLREATEADVVAFGAAL
jgi:hypothetical protein